MLWFIVGSLVGAGQLQCDTLWTFFNDTFHQQLWHQSCLRGWNPRTPDCCEWTGVTCKKGNVSELDLNGCGIKGELGQLLSIQSLTIARLDTNELSGRLPAVLPKGLKRLFLFDNEMTGPLDTTGYHPLENLGSLNCIDLHYNGFTGTLPAGITMDLSYPSGLYLSLANNKLQGTIPETWAKLTNLETIGLAYNLLSGTLAPLANMKSLKVIFLRNNTPGFSGDVPALPPKLGALYLDGNPNLTSLDLTSCGTSSPPSGWRTGCGVDYPNGQALDACCLTGDGWTDKVKKSPCLANCFKPQPAPHTYDCVVLSESKYTCQQDAFGTGPYLSKIECQGRCQAPAEQCTGNSTSLNVAECKIWQQFYDSTGGSNWDNCNDKAFRTDPCGCQWDSRGSPRGVNRRMESKGCDHIYSLDLSNNNVAGTVPSNFKELPQLYAL
jgi:hypothetical protein